MSWWRWVTFAAVVLCTVLLAAGPTSALMRVATSVASSASEEEQERVETTEDFARAAARRPMLVDALSSAVLALLQATKPAVALSARTRPVGDLAWLARDARLGVVAPLRC
jgi:hypothetical protein